MTDGLVTSSEIIKSASSTVGASRPSRAASRGLQAAATLPASIGSAEPLSHRCHPHEGASFTAIASRLGKAISTISREVGHNGGRTGCRGLAGPPTSSRACSSCEDAEAGGPQLVPRSRHG